MTSYNILVINPNSSASITAALERVLLPYTPPGVQLTFFNPKSGPRGISDVATANESTEACMAELTGPGTSIILSDYDGALVCCFSEHPLISALSEHFAQQKSSAVVLGIFHAAISAALLTPEPFGIIATGTGPKPNHIAGVATMLGSPTSTRFAGVITTGLGVVDLQDGDQERVERGMKETAVKLVAQGARTLLLGCAGMSGMDAWIHEAARSEGHSVRIIDGPKMGVELLVAMIRTSR